MSEEKGGFEIIIWRRRTEVMADCCLSLYLLIQETLQSKVYTRVSNLRNIFMVLEYC